MKKLFKIIEKRSNKTSWKIVNAKGETLASGDQKYSTKARQDAKKAICEIKSNQ